MPAKKTKKTSDPFKRHEKDTWSPEVQIWILWDEIKQLQEHIAIHKKDYDAKRSLLKKVARRRTFLKYLKSTKLSSYNQISKKINVKV